MTETIAFALLAFVLVTAGTTDCLTGKVYNWLTYPAMLAGVIFWTSAGFIQRGGAGAEHELFLALGGLAAGLIPFALIFLGGGLGGGDVKLMGAVGALSASWACVFSTAFYALLLAAAMAIVVMVRLGIVRRTLARLLGAALQAAARVKPDIPGDSPRIPFSLAIAIGGIIAAAEQLLQWQTPWRWMGL